MTPTATLLRALAQHLRRDVQPAVDGFLAYQNRIAANLVELLAREVALRETRRRAQDDLARRHGLDPDDPGRDLARRLRDHRVPPTEELVSALRERSLLALAVDNPRYSAYREGRRRWPDVATKIDAALGAGDQR